MSHLSAYCLSYYFLLAVCLVRAIVIKLVDSLVVNSLKLFVCLSRHHDFSEQTAEIKALYQTFNEPLKHHLLLFLTIFLIWTSEHDCVMTREHWWAAEGQHRVQMGQLRYIYPSHQSWNCAAWLRQSLGMISLSLWAAFLPPLSMEGATWLP